MDKTGFVKPRLPQSFLCSIKEAGFGAYFRIAAKKCAIAEEITALYPSGRQITAFKQPGMRKKDGKLMKIL